MLGSLIPWGMWEAAAQQQQPAVAIAPLSFNPNLALPPLYQIPPAMPTKEPEFGNPRERVIYSILKASNGMLHSEIARKIAASLDAMHLQEAFDLKGKLL